MKPLFLGPSIYNSRFINDSIDSNLISLPNLILSYTSLSNNVRNSLGLPSSSIYGFYSFSLTFPNILFIPLSKSINSKSSFIAKALANVVLPDLGFPIKRIYYGA